MLRRSFPCELAGIIVELTRPIIQHENDLFKSHGKRRKPLPRIDYFEIADDHHPHAEKRDIGLPDQRDSVRFLGRGLGNL